jgi:hypothetical protein
LESVEVRKEKQKDENSALEEEYPFDIYLRETRFKEFYGSMAETLWSILHYVYDLVCEVKKLPKTEDNKEFFQRLPTLLDNIFNLNIPLVKLPKIGFSEKRIISTLITHFRDKEY